jgi:formylglycine-generating enzyme
MSKLIICIFLSGLLPMAHAVNGPGIVKEKPTSGRFVRIDRGYMVPYAVKIPGTDAAFWMEPIPAGQFKMGSPASEAGRDDIEGPQVSYTVNAFWMARHEVTQGQFRHYMKMYSVFKNFKYKKYTAVKDENDVTEVDAVSAPTVIYEPEFIFEYGEHVDMPIITVTLYAAKQYSKWMSLITESEFRLPTEAEWEYACRAGTTTAYHFGNDPKQLGDYAWFAENSYDAGWRKVGLKKPNPWGLYDMYGNVAEWTHDHCVNYSTADFMRNAAQNWARTDKIDPRTVRGGSWEFAAEKCRSASRLPSDHDAWRDYDPELPQSPWWLCSDPARGVGLRLMRPLRPMSPLQRQEFWESTNDDTRYDVTDRIKEGRGAIGRVSKELMKAIQADDIAKERESK